MNTSIRRALSITRSDFQVAQGLDGPCTRTLPLPSMQRSRWLRCTLLACLSAIAACSDKDAGSPPQHAHAAIVDFPTSCDRAVQEDFDRAVTLLHHMTYPQARTAFRAIAERDPACAMAQWGIAMTLFTPLW